MAAPVIRCRCLTPHRGHEFVASRNGLCRQCSHNLAAHIDTTVPDAIVVLMQQYHLEDCSMTPDGTGGLRINIHLTQLDKEAAA